MNNNERRRKKKISKENKEKLTGRKLRDCGKQKSLGPSKKRKQLRKLNTIHGRTLFKLTLRVSRMRDKQRKLFQR